MKVACTSVTSSSSFIADKDVVRLFSQMELRPDMAMHTYNPSSQEWGAGWWAGQQPRRHGKLGACVKSSEEFCLSPFLIWGLRRRLIRKRGIQMSADIWAPITGQLQADYSSHVGLMWVTTASPSLPPIPPRGVQKAESFLPTSVLLTLSIPSWVILTKLFLTW